MPTARRPALCALAAFAAFAFTVATAPAALVPAPWPCTTALDCELNGDCVPAVAAGDHGGAARGRGSRCRCHAGWGGPACSVLQLLPATKGAGYRHTDAAGRQVSSWGGGVIYDSKLGEWNMFVAEIAGGCGMNSWFPNSRVVRAVATTPLGAYQRREVVLQTFAHNPQVVATPGGGVALYAIGSADVAADNVCRDCFNGSSNTAPLPTNATCRRHGNITGQRVSVWAAPSAAGPWAKAATMGLEPAWDNPAPFIFPNGSAIIMWRGTASEAVGCTALGRARDWRAGPFAPGAATPLFPPSTNLTVPAEPCLSDPAYLKPCKQANIEDPHVWRDSASGHFHALLHNGCDHNCPHVGRHAWSEDGASWTLSRNIAYTSHVQFTDGSNASAAASHPIAGACAN